MKGLLEQAAGEGVFPGAVAAAAWGKGTERQRCVVAAGYRSLQPVARAMTEKTLFDLASLTKPLATTLAVLCLLRQGKMALTETLADVFGNGVPEDKASISMAMLLGHCSGLPAWKPYFHTLVAVETDRRRQTLFGLIMAEELESSPGSAVRYSDLGFLLLAWAVEKRAGKNLDALLEEKILLPLGLEKELFFQPICRLHHGIFAATEACPWRERILVGEVHDDNAHALGGVAGHAGLFGTAAAVLSLAVFLLDLWKGRVVHPEIDGGDLRHFLDRRPCRSGNRVYGFDRPEAEGSSAGRLFSRRSVGHLGFTGTSFWIDPERDLVAVLLTNRVHPSRENEAIREFRPRFHDALAEWAGQGDC
ncbi:MAG: serine hydrolase domain-containing protein [Thermodesulfobacteriota bacterium]